MREDVMRIRIIVILAILTLACNFPGWPAPSTAPTSTPQVYVTVLVATPTPEAEEEKSTATSTPRPRPTRPTLSTPATVTTTLTLTAIAEATATATASATLTLTPTATPDGPTPTPTLAPLGPPLGFADPAWELLEWHKVPDEGDWEGTIRVHVVGGVPPYRFQIEDKPITTSQDLAVRWRLCSPMPATVRVWSADGQEANTPIWVWELGCDD